MNAPPDNGEPRFRRVAIIGLGLIGGSLGGALKRQGLADTVVAGSRSQRTLERGLALGVVDEIHQDPAEAVRDADLVFLAVPVSAMETVMQTLAPALADDAIVTDGGSVKQAVIAAAERSLGPHFARFVPAHPIAGKESSGVDAADAELYRDHRVILAPTDATEAQALERVRALWQALGARVLTMAPAEHDRVLAETSHLPHLLAFSLVDTLARQGDSSEIFRYAAGGFRDFTRIASSDPVMWHDIFRENRDAVLNAVDLFRSGLEEFRAAVDSDDSEAMLAAMTRANTAREHFLAMNEGTSFVQAWEGEDQPRNRDFRVDPGGTLTGTVRVPGDKSISHRAIMLGALADGQTTIDGFLEGEDALASLQAFRDLGVVIEGPHNGRVVVHGVGLQGLHASDNALYMGNSGTSMRLLTGLMAGQSFDTELTGDASLNRRPMERVAEPLRHMGAVIDTAEGGTPPIRVRGGQHLRGFHYDLPVASAQVKSAVLLAGLYAEGETSVTEPAPTRDHTERMLAGFGYPVERDGATCRLRGGGRMQGGPIDVPADISSAAFFLVGAAIAQGSELVLPRVGVNATRIGVIEILRQMGADIRLENEDSSGGEPVADLRVRGSRLRGIRIPEELVPLAIDEFPALFIAAACAEGETLLTGAEELRVKESDRIQVMADGLANLGIEAEPRPDGIRIVGGTLTGGEVDSHGDHRVAMSFAMAGLRATGAIHIRDCANVATSFPGFVELARHAGLVLDTEDAA